MMIIVKIGLYRDEMKKVSLLLGIHMHQPVDNFDEAVVEAISLAYAPFFETMLRYPTFKFSLHCSGWLLEKIRLEYPVLFSSMQELSKKGNIEWLSGGYYEPVLSAIPSCDRQAQIKKLNNYIEKYFYQKPQGLWLTERVWESSLVKDIKECNLEYVMVDDYHFLSNGFEKQRLNGYFITEDDAEQLALFPIAKDLRYALPFFKVNKAIEAILSHSNSIEGAAIIFDDAEKFGLWTDTNTWVYKQKWLEYFIEAILQHPAIKTNHYSTYKQENPSLGLAYLDNCSYEEMGEWSLSTQQARAFKEIKKREEAYIFKGGIWKNFFIKYHESNYLHKRMLCLSKEQSSFNVTMLESLYKLQTNDVFWHGAFGGLYLPNLRDNAYRYLLEIEAKQASKSIAYNCLDIDQDGYDELKVLTEHLSIVISAKNGAQMVEFGSVKHMFNWQNTLMRRDESYYYIEEKHEQKGVIPTIHDQKSALNSSEKQQLLFDWHAKNSFIEHFAKEPFTLENFQNLTFKEVGDFANQAFKFKDEKFIREGGIYLYEDNYTARLQKKYTFSTDKISLQSRFLTEYSSKLYFAQEFNLHFAHPQKVTFNGEYIEDGWSVYDSNILTIVDDFTNSVLSIKTSCKCNIFAFILHTLSKSEDGFEAIAQQISFLFTTGFQKKLTFKVSLEAHDV